MLLLLPFTCFLLITGIFGEILYKRAASLNEQVQCSTSGLKVINIASSPDSLLQFSLNAVEFASSGNSFKRTLISLYDRNDRQVASLQVVTLRDQFAQVVLLDRKGRELGSSWEAIKKAQLKVSLDSNSVYLNGHKLLFQLNSKSTQTEVEPFPEKLQTAEKPVEWKEIEEFLTQELQANVQLQWQEPAAVTAASFSSKEQVFLNQAPTFRIALRSVKYAVFAEDVVQSVSFESSRKSFWRFFALAKLPQWRVEKETLLMAALVSGFVAYLAILTLLSRMSVKKKNHQQPQQQQPSSHHQQQVQLQKPILQSLKTSTYNSQSQTKSTEILRPIFLTKFHRSSQLALLDSSSMHLEIHHQQQPQLQHMKQASQSGEVHELSLRSLSFNLADNRHILFPSKLRNYQK